MVRHCYWHLPLAALASCFVAGMGAPLVSKSQPQASSTGSFRLPAGLTLSNPKPEELQQIYKQYLSSAVPQSVLSNYYDYAGSSSSNDDQGPVLPTDIDLLGSDAEGDPEVREVFRLLALGDEEAWNNYGDILLSAVDDMLANGEVSSVEEGIVLLLYPDLPPEDVQTILSESGSLSDLMQGSSSGAGAVEDSNVVENDFGEDEFPGSNDGDFNSIADDGDDDGQLEGGDKRSIAGKKGEASATTAQSAAGNKAPTATKPTKPGQDAAAAAAANEMVYDVDDVLKAKRGQPEQPIFPGNHEDKSKQ